MHLFVTSRNESWSGVQVSIFGDGTSSTRVDSNLNSNYEKLVNIGTDAAVPKDVKSSYDALNAKIAS